MTATKRDYIEFASRIGIAARAVSTLYTAGGLTLEIDLIGPGSPTGTRLDIPLDVAPDPRSPLGLADILLAIQTVCFVAELPFEELPRESGSTREDHALMLAFQGSVKDALGNEAYDEFMTRLGHVEGWAMGRDNGSGAWGI